MRFMNYEVHHYQVICFVRVVPNVFVVFTVYNFEVHSFLVHPMTDVICLGAGKGARSAYFPALMRARGAERVRRSRTSGAGARAPGTPTDLFYYSIYKYPCSFYCLLYYSTVYYTIL